MHAALPLPRFDFPEAMPTLWQILRQGVSDPARIMPAAILHEPAVQLPGPGAPLVIADPVLVREVLNDRDGRFTSFKLMRRLLRRAWVGASPRLRARTGSASAARLRPPFARTPSRRIVRPLPRPPAQLRQAGRKTRRLS
jgi:hypothetical protein